jgi:hypothetical protein
LQNAQFVNVKAPLVHGRTVAQAFILWRLITEGWVQSHVVNKVSLAQGFLRVGLLLLSFVSITKPVFRIH